MESESAKPASSGPDAGRAPPDDANRQATAAERIASSSSSFRGLVGAPGSSFGDGKPGQSDPNQTLGLGQTFGRYQIRKVLGSGSMGSVFLAHDAQLDRQVALKVPQLEHDSTGELTQRLYREARAAATLNHPNICPIYDVSEHEGTCFIAMGYVSGQPLAAYIASKKRQPEREAAKVVRKLALALQEAHQHGILHRDLKPTNIMIDKRGEPIVMDFGIACWFDDQTQTRLTQQGAIVGTPAYMSPEQIEGRSKIGPASDIYSLGVLLYQILTGRCPFEGTVLNVISQVLHQDPPDAREFRPDLSPELIAICERAMRKNPPDRFASMLDFAKALTAFLNGSPRGEKPQKDAPKKDASEIETIQFVPPKVMRPKRPTAPLPALPRRGNRPRGQKKNQRNWIPAAVTGGIVAALLVIGVSIGALFTRRSGGPQIASTNSAGNDAGAPPWPTKSIETPGPPRPAPKTQAAAVPPARPLGVPAPSKADDASNSAAGHAATSLPATPVKGRASPISVVASGSSPASLPTAASSNVSQSKLPQISNSKPAVLPNPVVTNPPAPRMSRPAAGTADVSGAGASPARAKAPDPDDMGPSPADDPDSPRPEGTRRRRNGQLPDDNLPPAGPDGRRPFDGGPTRGMSIEAYFKKLDVNRDGKLDPGELPMHIIMRADRNKDGELTLKELVAAYKRRGRKLFGPPTAAEMRRLPRGPRPPWNGSPPPGGGGPGRPGF
jgi:predicted Ser/Thr protein kinase